MNIFLYFLNGRNDVSNLDKSTKPRENIETFFYQGNGASRSQAALYAGNNGVKVITKDGIYTSVCKYSATLLHNIYTYSEITEISYSRSINPIPHFQCVVVDNMGSIFPN